MLAAQRAENAEKASIHATLGRVDRAHIVNTFGFALVLPNSPP